MDNKYFLLWTVLILFKLKICLLTTIQVLSCWPLNSTIKLWKTYFLLLPSTFDPTHPTSILVLSTLYTCSLLTNISTPIICNLTSSWIVSNPSEVFTLPTIPDNLWKLKSLWRLNPNTRIAHDLVLKIIKWKGNITKETHNSLLRSSN